jgi:hypothetical protein
MNPDTIKDLSYFDRLRVIRTLKYTGDPVPLKLILEHLRHTDQIYAIPQVEFDFVFEGHSQETKDLWAPIIFAPIELSDSDSDESDDSDEPEIISQQLTQIENTVTDSTTPEISSTEESKLKTTKKALDFIPFDSNKVPNHIKRKYPFLEEQIKIKISRDSARQVQLS